MSGVSGSGKSTLVHEILYPVLNNHLQNIESGQKKGYKSLEGDLSLIDGVELVGQKAIGRSSRSNPATYVKAFDDIRNIFANQNLSKIRGYSAGHFSFNRSEERRVGKECSYRSAMRYSWEDKV